MSRVRATVLLLTVLLVVAAISFTVVDRRATERDQRERRAVTAATRAVTAVLDYRSDTVADDLAGAEDLLAPPFLDRFRERTRTVTVPRSRADAVSSTARTVGAALDSASEDAALVVVYLDRHTLDRDGISHVLQTVVEVGLVRDDDRWLAAELTPR